MINELTFLKPEIWKNNFYFLKLSLKQMLNEALNVCEIVVMTIFCFQFI